MSPIQQKLGIRLIIGLFTIAALFAGWNWFQDFAKDPDTVRFNSVDHIAAIRTNGSVSQVVVFKPNGEIIESPVPAGFDPKDPKAKPFLDQSVSWAPNGHQVFFSSNRASESFNIYRWNPARKDVEQRSAGSRSQSTPMFGPANLVDPSRSSMILSGGFVFLYDPKEQITEQVLPPVVKNRLAKGEEGASGPMDELYRNLGSSFKDARWGQDQAFVFISMRRDLGEVFAVNPLGRDAQGNFLRPQPTLAGKSLQFSVSPDGTAAAVSQREFQYLSPEQIPQDMINADGTYRNPYEHGLLKVTIRPGQAPNIEPIALWRKAGPGEEASPETVFLDPSVSPDGTKVAVVVARIPAPNKVEVLGIVVMPFATNGGSQGVLLTRGDVSSPSWSPKGDQLVFIRRESGRGSVFTIRADGTGERRLGSGEGDFSRPVFSPQLAQPQG